MRESALGAVGLIDQLFIPRLRVYNHTLAQCPGRPPPVLPSSSSLLSINSGSISTCSGSPVSCGMFTTPGPTSIVDSASSQPTAASKMQPPAEPRPVQNQLLVRLYIPGSASQPRLSSSLQGDENVLVLTKARFFRTLRILLDYAQHPERRTWEFFSYRPWDYILGTYCLTFDLHEWAVSCGPQHPCLCLRPLPRPHDAVQQARLEYAQPDFTLMANSFGKEGELLFLGEAKAMGKVEPDTVNAYNLASAAFLVAEPQRKRQARLAFERHPESDLINILMMCGSFWSVWSYKRSTFRFDLPPPASDLGRGETDDQIPPSSDARNHPSPDRSPPYKIRRTNKTCMPSTFSICRSPL